MLRRDPELAAPPFREHCASCHRLGDMGPKPEKATAPDLDGWGTPEWAMSMLVDPDASNRFGQTAYKSEMVSVVKPPPHAVQTPTPFRNPTSKSKGTPRRPRMLRRRLSSRWLNPRPQRDRPRFSLAKQPR